MCSYIYDLPTALYAAKNAQVNIPLACKHSMQNINFIHRRVLKAGNNLHLNLLASAYQTLPCNTCMDRGSAYVTILLLSFSTNFGFPL
jgi:hypothetical protein